MNIICCTSCGVGSSSVTNEEIQKQIEKYDGIYICKDCEKTIDDLANGEFGKFKTHDDYHCLITNNGIYVDKGMKPRNERFLGFGGSLFLIIETVQDGYFKKKKTYLTNNLFSIKSIHGSLVNKYKHNINAEIIRVDWDSFDELKKQLEKINM